MKELLVDTLGTEPVIVAEDGKERAFRKVSSLFRGPARTVVEEAIHDAFSKQEPLMRPVPDTAVSVLGRFCRAEPVIGPDRAVYGMHLLFGDGSEPGPARTVGAYQWEIEIPGLPPRLDMNTAAMDLMGIPAHHRDRTVYGPLDYFAHMVRLSDVIQVWETVNSAAAGHASAGTFIVGRPAGDGSVLDRIHYSQRYVVTDSGPRLRGLCEGVSVQADMAAMRMELLDVAVRQTATALTHMFGVVGDLRWPAAPCVLKWLTPSIPGIGHGVSTGQTPGFHPDDFPRILKMIDDVRHGPVDDYVRIRKGGGGWLRTHFTSNLIDPELSPTLGVAMVYGAEEYEGSEDD